MEYLLSYRCRYRAIPSYSVTNTTNALRVRVHPKYTFQQSEIDMCIQAKHTNTHTHARTHARANTHTHTHTHTYVSLSLSLSLYIYIYMYRERERERESNKSPFHAYLYFNGYLTPWTLLRLSHPRLLLHDGYYIVTIKYT